MCLDAIITGTPLGLCRMNLDCTWLLLERRAAIKLELACLPFLCIASASPSAHAGRTSRRGRELGKWSVAKVELKQWLKDGGIETGGLISGPAHHPCPCKRRGTSGGLHALKSAKREAASPSASSAESFQVIRV